MDPDIRDRLWQSKLATFIAFSLNRGTATINDNFANGFESAVLVHDCWKSHFETSSITHQICTAHLLRELNYFEEHYQSSWARAFKNILYEAINLKKILSPADYYYPINQRTELEEKLGLLLQTSIPQYMKEVCSFQKRITRYKDYLFILSRGASG